MRLHNFINVAAIHIAVPDGFGVNHGHWTSGTPIQATRLVNPHLTWPRQASRLDLDLAALKSRQGVQLRTASFAILALVEAEKNMPMVITGNWLGVWTSDFGEVECVIPLILVSWLSAPDQTQ